MTITVLDGTTLEGLTAGYFVYDGVSQQVYLANSTGAIPVGPSSFNLGAHASDAAAEVYANLFPGFLRDGVSYVNTTLGKIRYRVDGAWRSSDEDTLLSPYAEAAEAAATAAALSAAEAATSAGTLVVGAAFHVDPLTGSDMNGGTRAAFRHLLPRRLGRRGGRHDHAARQRGDPRELRLP